MEALQRLSFRLRVVPISLFQNNTNTLLLPSSPSVSSSATTVTTTRIPVLSSSSRRRCLSSTRGRLIRPAWFAATKKSKLPNIVKAGDPVLHEPAKEVDPNEINSERVQKIIADMINVMRKAPGVGLAAPQIGIPLRVGLLLSLIYLYFGCPFCISLLY